MMFALLESVAAGSLLYFLGARQLKANDWRFWAITVGGAIANSTALLAFGII